MKIHFFLLCLAGIFCIELHAQNRLQYDIKIKSTNAAVITPKLKMGTDVRPDGESLSYTGNYLLRNGKPWFPIMGEFNYERYQAQQWEQEILAMKAGGVEVISSYVIWIFHEKQKGVFDWSGNNDLRRFLALCKKHGMYVWIRIGPWVHAEIKNGGFPDWLMAEKIKLRTDDPAYLNYADRFFKQEAKQCEGYYFKDGGPIIGAQLENELNFKNAPEYEHMKALKRMAIQDGIDVPYYSGFAPGPDNQDEFLYTLGSYPDSPWNTTTKAFIKPVYFIRPLKADDDIGSDLLGKVDANVRNNYPLISAELGAGMQKTYHRRVDVSATDVAANIFTKLAAGLNGFGYFMFHGGMTPLNWANNNGFQESRVSNYPNDMPLLNYDFQAPLGAMGIPAPSFSELKLLNLFAQDYGSKLAETRPYFTTKLKSSMFSTDTVQASARTKNGAGFIFLSNYQRLVALPAIKNFQLDLNDGSKSEMIPARPITFPANHYVIWPYKLDMQGALLKYATVQPLAILNNGTTKTFVFFRDSIAPEMVFDNTTIKKVSALKGCLWDAKNGVITSDKKQDDFYFEMVNKAGETVKVLVIKRNRALQAYKINYNNGKEALIFTKALLRQQANNQWSVEAASKDGKIEVETYPGTVILVKSISNTASCKKVNAGSIFNSFIISEPITNKPSVSYSRTVDGNTRAARLFKDSILNVFKKSKQFNPLQPGPLYLPTFHSLPNQQLYQSKYNCERSAGVIDWEVTVHYDGDVLTIYQNNKLLYDQFNYNGICKYRLNYLVKNTAAPVLLQIVPAEKQYDIYWGSLEKTLNDQLTAKIKSIDIVPVYRYGFSIKRND
ncbi:glycosyl hydrolase family 35 [Mucilaginibacter yixingensis]|uniref:Glycosyl hydrolase family 35 n=1 Tax=Mucilaginibacter yixingensis TaxID=1295612 RepID=A0A2T5J639_9SPHI|nr:beta-galactosidase [Mucilaginibacter yixingensis]PTQ93959.1 glycosyl hydrolase family 35 [Mucilaginibacter yixingensis]